MFISHLTKPDIRILIHSFIGLFLMVFIGLLPPPEPVTILGMKVLGILIGMIYLWITVDTLWPSLLGLVGMILCGYGTPEEILGASFGNPYTVMTIFMLAFCGIMEEYKINEYIGCWFLERKIINGRPWVFTFIWFVTAAILAMFCHAVISVFFLWSVLYHLAETLNLKRGTPYLTAMLVGTVFSAMIAQVIFPFKDMGLFMIGTFESMSAMEVPVAPYILLQSVTCLFSILAYMLLMRFLFRVDVTPFRNIRTDQIRKESLPPMSRLQIFLLAMLGGLMVALCIPSFLPPTVMIAEILQKLGMTGIVMLFFAVLCIVRADEKSLVDFQKLAKEKVSWNLIFLIAVALCTSTALTDDSTGIKEFLSIVCSPLFNGRSDFTFTAMITLATLILTNVANNGVVGILFLTISYIFSPQITGSNLFLLVTLVTFCVTDALILPSASIYGAILHGNTQWLTKKETLVYSSAAVCASYAVVMFVAYPLGKLLF